MCAAHFVRCPATAFLMPSAPPPCPPLPLCALQCARNRSPLATLGGLLRARGLPRPALRCAPAPSVRFSPPLRVGDPSRPPPPLARYPLRGALLWSRCWRSLAFLRPVRGRGAAAPLPRPPSPLAPPCLNPHAATTPPPTHSPNPSHSPRGKAHLTCGLPVRSMPPHL